MLSKLVPELDAREPSCAAPRRCRGQTLVISQTQMNCWESLRMLLKNGIEGTMHQFSRSFWVTRHPRAPGAVVDTSTDPYHAVHAGIVSRRHLH